MSRIDDWSDAERQLYAVGTRAILDDLERKQAEWRESWALDTTSTDARVREHNERMRQLEEDHKAWLARFINGETDEGSHTDVAQGQAVGASAASPSPAGPGGPGPGQPDPRLAEAELAAWIKNMPLNEYAAMRDELGVQSPTSMNRLFARETR
jgi:hypothetical protein